MADLQSMLVKTSRTFALAIPLLPEPTCREVTIAYLLFRIADTFEDATAWTPEAKVQALADLERVLEPGQSDEVRRLAARWCAAPPLDHEGYLELLEETPAVLEALWALEPAAQAVIRRHLRRTIQGMARYAHRVGQGKHLQLETIDELSDYCYIVAGIVGEMLTELFVLDWDALASDEAYLMKRARCFGEGLQLTNILKDSEGDATEGRRYLPAGVARERVFQLAREDLERAEEYVHAVQRAGAPVGVIAFNALPVILAWETLERVRAAGPGAKLDRMEVATLMQAMDEALEGGAPVVQAARTAMVRER